MLPDVATTLPQRQPLPASGCLHREAQAASRIEVVNIAVGSDMKKLQTILQRFCDSRGARVQISEAEVCRLQEV